MKVVFLTLALLLLCKVQSYDKWDYDQYGPAKKLIDELDSI